jgi:polar amino acid transport system substrate-binding protein
VFIAYFTAAVTSNLTVQQLHGDINGPDDLPGKRVASVKGSTSTEYLRQRNVEVSEFAKVEEAFQALIAGEADAVVYDAPVLLISHRTKAREKFKPSAPFSARRTTASSFRTRARCASGSMKPC